MNARELAEKSRMLSVDEVEAIKYTVGLIHTEGRIPVVVNIGAGVGTSSMAILEARPDIFVFEVDKKMQQVAIENMQLSGLEQQRRLVRIIGKSWDVGRNWPFQVDMVFVDGAHHDEAVMADIVAWKPHVRPFGYMLFHDYNHHNIPSLTTIVDREMQGYDVVCRARFLIGYQIK